MRVERLELHGFKSFCDRTVFNLHPGITCIVGPNGCGKSNIVDAFKWVLGEQSAKSLRGERMEEVIFNGSQNRKPKGMSDVRLVVSGLIGSGDNGGERPLSVGRRLYRSGDSEYLLNREVSRLRDIRDIFLDTGLEVKSYSILEQDRIAAILNAKPDERRFIIEEVAGVVKYKVRRQEAQSKLESSRNNLQRISDIVAEIRRQINALDRQVRKAERYKALNAELRDVELRLARHEYAELIDELQEIMAEAYSLRETDSLKRAEVSQAESEIETGRIGLAEKEKFLEALNSELQAQNATAASHEREIAVLRTDADNLRENIGRLKQDEEETVRKIQEADKRGAQAGEQAAALEREIEDMSARVANWDNLLSENQDAIARIEETLETKRKDAFRVSEELGTLRNTQARHQEALEALKRRQESLGREAQEQSSALEQTRAGLTSIESQVSEKNSELESLGRRRETAAGEVEALKGNLEELRSQTNQKREELASSASKLESLREMVGSENASRQIRDEIDVMASVSDVIEVPKEYETAIESALGETISGLVLGGYEDIARAVSAIRQRDIGRTALVPKSLSFGGSNSPQLPDGAVAWAADLVKAQDEYASMVRGLLGNVAVVKDIGAALNTAANGVTFVALEGEMLTPAGAVIAGKSSGILAQKRQVRELTDETETLRKDIAALEGRTAETVQAITSKEEELRAAADRAVEAEKEISLLKHRVESQRQEIERAERKLEVLRMEATQAEDEGKALTQRMEEKAGEIGRFEQDRGTVDASISEVQEQLSKARAEHESKRAESVEARLGLSSTRERLNSLRGEASSVETLKNELRGKGESLRREMALTEERIKERHAEASSKDEALKEVVVKARELEGRISKGRQVIQEGYEDVRSREQRLRVVRVELDGIAQGLSGLEVRRTEHKMRAENLVENIRNAYQVELPKLPVEEIQEGDEEAREDIRDKIDRLGPVSLGSIEEYEALKERYDFLNKQQEDLQRSISELEEAIAKINATTRKMLRDAYEALKVKFAEVFKALFGGGRAELVLTDERNILETGIEIVAQPPGKKLQSISLLSGGEKTLTALGLLFASFLIKPTPLCILDEADAALDESNTEKFAAMIRELAAETQFVVVTHNRVTMESADYIYGVTMEEPGVSKVISMELTEA